MTCPFLTSSLTESCKRLADDIQARAVLAYSVLLSAAAAGESVDPVSALRIMTAAGKSFERLQPDLEAIEIANGMQGTIRRFVALRDAAVRNSSVGLILEANEKIAGGQRVIAEIQTAVFGDYERGE